MPSPGASPSSCSAWASAFERRSRSAHVSVPSSSTSAGRSGWRIAEATAPAASVGPQRCSAYAVRASLSGRVGRMIPVPARMRAVPA